MDKKIPLLCGARVLVTIKLCESSAWLLSLQLLDGYFIQCDSCFTFRSESDE
jgi:hypothetical protein